MTVLLVSGCGGAGVATPPTAPPASPPASPTSPPASPPASPTTPPASPPASPTTPPASPTTPPASPPASPTTPPASPTTPPASPPASPTSPIPGAEEPVGIGPEILFLRGGDLYGLEVASGAERLISSQVSEFAATPDGRQLALIRGAGLASEIWLIERTAGEPTRLTSNEREEFGLSWAPDGLSLAFASSPSPRTALPDWPSWSSDCAVATVRVIDLPAAAEREIGPGCDPAFAPDGTRLAYASAPSTTPDQLPFPGSTNSIRLVNRQGANGWNFASADGGPDQGYLVYAPAWSPDAQRLSYQRFLGYQALVDINLTEQGGALQGDGAPLLVGAGWMLPPTYGPSGQAMAVVDHNFSDARGFSGYDIWSLALLDLTGSEETFIPSGDLSLSAAQFASLTHVTAVAWEPAGTRLVASLPSGWAPGAPTQEPAYPNIIPGELWLLDGRGAPQRRIAAEIDFRSPLAWLPASPAAISDEDARMRYPASFGLREPARAGEWIADDGSGRIFGLRRISGDLPAAIDPLFADLVTVEQAGAPLALPDGSQLIGFSGRDSLGRAVAGAVRLIARPGRDALALVAMAPADAWPLERSAALGMLGGGGAPIR